MPLQLIEPRRLYRQIADQLRRLMEAGDYAPGTRLPPERDLAAQLGVSRPSVREALIALEVEGLVEVRGGSGIYVRPREAAAAPAPRVAADSPFEVMRARELVEGELAAVAALSFGPDEVAALREAIAVIRDDVRAGGAPIRGDRLFHLRIAEAADNAVLMRLVGELFDERNNPLFARLGSHFETDRNWGEAIVEHEAIVAAIAANDAAAARAAMHRHLQRSQERFAAGFGIEPALTTSDPHPPRTP